MHDIGEAYRVRRAKRKRDGSIDLVPYEPDTAIYATYREACVAVKRAGLPRGKLVTQSIMIDTNMRVVFPPEAVTPKSAGRWHVAPRATNWEKDDAKGKRGQKALPGRSHGR